MSISNKCMEERCVYDSAEEYKQRGYAVTVSPPPKRLPELLSKFTPDIVAEGPNESVVIEVKSVSKVRGVNYWKELSSIVRQHPGWRFQLVVNNVSSLRPSATI